MYIGLMKKDSLIPEHLSLLSLFFIFLCRSCKQSLVTIFILCILFVKIRVIKVNSLSHKFSALFCCPMRW